MHILQRPIEKDVTSQVTGSELLLEGAYRSILIVEDDMSQKPFWEKVLKVVDAHIKVDWVTTMEEAESLIKIRYHEKQPYDAVIADIFLAGTGSGVDLWNRYGGTVNNFLFVSSLPEDKFERLMSLTYACPMYLKKPLRASMCVEMIKLFINKD